MYWTDYILETIEVVSVDGSYRTVLLSSNMSNPRAIALDPSERYIDLLYIYNKNLPE